MPEVAHHAARKKSRNLRDARPIRRACTRWSLITKRRVAVRTMAKRTTARELMKLLKRHGCTVTSGKGSHVKVRNGVSTSVSIHSGDIPTGTWRKIVKTMEPSLGKGWEDG